ncbi:MAG: NERD domain-containing protein/DEAD/DEAH box helicase [Azoarcus sp.]|jgi:hypothetical protein|nr:NERD domain-containing protein/DEAD/DEAH box helicase [Azoarcus sp.]
MRMIPAQPHDTHSRAELRVFDQLRAAFANDDRWFALHSLNLPRHAYKRFGEIDFVVCGPDGLFVLEVKGGKVACHDGIWETTNRYGHTERLKESPFRQAASALHGLRDKLSGEILAEFVVGYGVITPDCTGIPASAEWDAVTLADAKKFHQFEKWLKNLIAYWREKDARPSCADPESLHLLQQALRPDFEAILPLCAAVHEVETRIIQLTNDQLKLVDVIEINPRVLCSGGAGTGKTLLAFETARRWTASGLRVALACHSPWLKSFLAQTPVRGLTVCLANDIGLAANRAGVRAFDALIIDEGQDLLDGATLKKLDMALAGGMDEGRWCFFHDVNNQAGLCGICAPDAHATLARQATAQVPLRTNCRNSLQILRKVQETLNADMGVSGVGEGPEVRYREVAHPGEAARALAAELDELINGEGFAPGEITVLSPLPFHRSCASAREVRGMLAVLDESAVRHAHRSTTGFAEISHYKGLESEVVILIDMPPPGATRDLRALHYVGMSRARAMLDMVCERPSSP